MIVYNTYWSIVPSVHFRDMYGRKPLHVAAMTGCVECIALLLDHGATSDVKNEEGYIPLHIAAMMGHVASMEALSHKSRCDINDDDDDRHSSVEPLIFGHKTVETESKDNFDVACVTNPHVELAFEYLILLEEQA